MLSELCVLLLKLFSMSTASVQQLQQLHMRCEALHARYKAAHYAKRKTSIHVLLACWTALIVEEHSFSATDTSVSVSRVSILYHTVNTISNMTQ
jgi:hypothetical protein